MIMQYGVNPPFANLNARVEATIARLQSLKVMDLSSITKRIPSLDDQFLEDNGMCRDYHNNNLRIARLEREREHNDYDTLGLEEDEKWLHDAFIEMYVVLHGKPFPGYCMDEEDQQFLVQDFKTTMSIASRIIQENPHAVDALHDGKMRM